MSRDDQLDLLLDSTVDHTTHLAGVLFLCGVLCLIGGWILHTTELPLFVTSTATLPPFPTREYLRDNLTKSSSSAQQVDINHATLEALDELPGVGTVRAQKIIENRPYTSFDDFRIRSSLSTNLVNSLQMYVHF